LKFKIKSKDKKVFIYDATLKTLNFHFTAKTQYAIYQFVNSLRLSVFAVKMTFWSSLIND